MSKASVEQMKKIIEDKKKKGQKKDTVGNTLSKFNSGPTKGFKSNKRSGSLNK
jgi:hypothetical protein